jgi:hypothetical protein
MDNATRLWLVPALGLAAFISMSYASAQQGSPRDAAIRKCVEQAHKEFPRPMQEDDNNRTFAYMACMSATGFQP